MNRKDRRAAGKRPLAGALPGASARGPAGEAEQLFAAAVRHHQAGQLVEAEGLYRQVLSRAGDHFGSLHHLGILALQRGDARAATDAIGRALAVNRRVAECQYNMAFALQTLGRPDEAAGHYREAVRLKPDYVEAHTNLGNVLRELGKLADAAAVYERVLALKPSAEAHYNLANTLGLLRRLDEAVNHYRRALALKPELVGAHNNLANALVEQGRLEEALEHFQRALALDPGLVEVHVNFGIVLMQKGMLDAAAAQLGRAVALKPDFADAHSNLGNVYLSQGRLDEAAASYERALALKPELAPAHNNLGIVLAARGRFEDASLSFQRALALQPDFIDAYNNLGRAFMALGQPDHALGALRRALALVEGQDTKSLFVQSVKMLALPPNVEDFRTLMVRALTEPWGRTTDLAPVAARLLKQDEVVAAVMARATAAWPRRLAADALLGTSGPADLARHRLLRCLIEAAPVGDLELERLLTALRFALLQLISQASMVEDDVRDLCCSLARQCFLNEYVFACGDEELAEAQRQRDMVVKAAASGGAIAEPLLAIAACYFPLHVLPGAEQLLERSWSAAVEGMLVQQVREPMEEWQLRATIPRLTPIEDNVSRAVQQQYEENPYPRWAAADPAGEPIAFDLYLRRRLPMAAFQPLGKAQIDVLIAGCGTGQHAIETAQRFAGAKVLAVDLSLTSLAFAVRKTRALEGVQIEYGQADILALGSLGRSFDLIESSGVLHHLADPFAGWRVLLSLLRPGGIMTVGLYSEIARTNLVDARAFIAERGYGATTEDIRRCREDLLALDGGARFRNVAASQDFFTVSACRDLLFHVQEHRFTLRQIAEFIAESDLAFLGFDLENFAIRRYQARFPHDAGLTDLAAWDAFERDHPATFSGMYQFWVQKKKP
jgi:tetratricopeptide (TPR) repeat protein/SAM-dependent methyltransferase